MNIEVPGEKDLIWVPKKLAEEYKQLESCEEQEKLVKQVLRDRKLDIENELNMLSEDAIRFKASCLAHRNELHKIYMEEYGKVDQILSDTDSLHAKVRADAKKLESDLRPISDSINGMLENFSKLKKQLEEFNVYGADRVVDLVGRISQLDEKSKDALVFLAHNYMKKPE